MSSTECQLKELSSFCLNSVLPKVSFPPSDCLPTIQPPTIADLVEPEVQKNKKSPPGLFEQMLNKDVHLLLEMLEANPHADHLPAFELLTALQAGARRYEDLSREECALIDEVAADALCSSRKRPTRTRAESILVRPPKDTQEQPEHNRQHLNAFWWL